MTRFDRLSLSNFEQSRAKEIQERNKNVTFYTVRLIRDMAYEEKKVKLRYCKHHRPDVMVVTLKIKKL